MKKNYADLGLPAGSHRLGSSPKFPITGIVISAEDNEPIIGASVLVKGSTTGAVTDLDGKFTITDARRCENPASVFRRYDNTRSSHHSGDDKSHIKE